MSNRDIPLVPSDTSHEEAVHHIVNSLSAFKTNSDEIFRRAQQRLNQSASRISTLSQRLDGVSRKIDYIKEVLLLVP